MSGSMVMVSVDPTGRSDVPVKVGLPEIATGSVLMATVGALLSSKTEAVFVEVMLFTVTAAVTVRLPSTWLEIFTFETDQVFTPLDPEITVAVAVTSVVPELESVMVS